MKTFELYIRKSDKTIELLKYIEKNIGKINAIGVKLEIERYDVINADVMNMLKNRGVLRMPALVTHDKVFTGYKNIVDIFEQNISKDHFDPNRVLPIDDDASDDISKFWNKELFSGQYGDGTLIPRKDAEEDMSEVIDYSTVKKRELSMQHQRNKKPSRNMHTTRERNNRDDDDDIQDNVGDDIAAQTTSAMQDRAQGGRQQFDRRGGGRSNPRSGGDLDSQMLNAWLENNTETEGGSKL